MRKSIVVFVNLLLMVLMIALPGCNFPWDQSNNLSNEAELETQVAGTIAAMQSSDEQANTQEVPSSPEENTPIPSPTETTTPTVTLTETMTPTPEQAMVSVSTDTNCRSGPGTIYDYVGALLVGEQAEIVGQSEDGGYWIIKNPDRDGECWLWGQYATVQGETTILPMYTQPPTPTPAFSWEGTWTLYFTDLSGTLFMVFPMTITIDGNSFLGSGDLGGGDSVNLTGTVSNDSLSVSGTWVGPTNNGSFEFFAFGVNQFQGNIIDRLDVKAAWCGGRSGAGIPSPCYKD